MGFLRSKNKEKKPRDKAEKRSWFSPRKSTENEYSETTDSVPSTRTSPKSNDLNSKSFDEEILATEQAVQRQIRRLEARQRDLTLQSDTGVLLFEGMNMQHLDEQSVQEINQYGNPMGDTYETGFVTAPKYDPVKSGFYGKQKKNYYDSDDEDDTVPGVSPRERTSNQDGSIWDLMNGFLMQPSSSADVGRKPRRD